MRISSDPLLFMTIKHILNKCIAKGLFLSVCSRLRTQKVRLNESLLKNFLKPYGLTLLDFRLMTAGMENSSAFVRTQSGAYLLRVYRSSKSKDRIRTELDFMNFISNHVPVPKLVPNNVGSVLSSKTIHGRTWLYIVMEFIKGDHLRSDQIQLIPQVARYQALMHKGAIVFEAEHKEKWNTLSQASSYFENGVEKARKYLNIDECGREVLKRMDSVMEETRVNLQKIAKLPTGFVHRDYYGGNILAQEDSIAGIIDFDDLAYQPFALDIANTLWWWLRGNVVRAQEVYMMYLLEYENMRKLSDDEKDFLVLFMRRRNIIVEVIVETDLKKQVESEALKRALAFDTFLVDTFGK